MTDKELFQEMKLLEVYYQQNPTEIKKMGLNLSYNKLEFILFSEN